MQRHQPANKIKLFCFDFDLTITSDHLFFIINNSSLAKAHEDAQWERASKIPPRGTPEDWKLLFETLIQDGRKIAIVTHNTYEALIVRYLKKVIGLPNDIMEQIEIVAMKTDDTKYDKQKHIAFAMGFLGLDDQNCADNEIVLIDDGENNISKARERGYCTIQVSTRNIKDAPHIQDVYEIAGLSVPEKTRVKSKVMPADMSAELKENEEKAKPQKTVDDLEYILSSHYDNETLALTVVQGTNETYKMLRLEDYERVQADLKSSPELGKYVRILESRPPYVVVKDQLLKKIQEKLKAESTNVDLTAQNINSSNNNVVNATQPPSESAPVLQQSDKKNDDESTNADPIVNATQPPSESAPVLQQSDKKNDLENNGLTQVKEWFSASKKQGQEHNATFYRNKLKATFQAKNKDYNIIGWQKLIIQTLAKEKIAGKSAYTKSDLIEIEHFIQDLYLEVFKNRLRESDKDANKRFNLEARNRQFEQLNQDLDNLEGLVHRKSLWWINVDKIFGIKKTATWQKNLAEIRTDAWSQLETELRENREDLDAQIKLLGNAREMAIFKDHKNNSLFFGAFGQTGTVIKIDNKLKELRKQLSEQQASARKQK